MNIFGDNSMTLIARDYIDNNRPESIQLDLDFFESTIKSLSCTTTTIQGSLMISFDNRSYQVKRNMGAPEVRFLHCIIETRLQYTPTLMRNLTSYDYWQIWNKSSIDKDILNFESKFFTQAGIGTVDLILPENFYETAKKQLDKYTSAQFYPYISESEIVALNLELLSFLKKD